MTVIIMSSAPERCHFCVPSCSANYPANPPFNPVLTIALLF
jgi:hypothetical protein